MELEFTNHVHVGIMYVLTFTRSSNIGSIKFLNECFMSFNICIFFSIRVFFTDTDDSQDSRGREGTIFYSTLPLPPSHEH